MGDDPTPESQSQNARIVELASHERGVRQREMEKGHHSVSSRYAYRMKLGRVTVKLDPVEFRILQFLASQPYRAFTRKRIASAVSTRLHPVEPATLDQHIARLRDALGFFRDYIQTVPYIGYRFRA